MSSVCVPVSSRSLPKIPQPHASANITAAGILFLHIHDFPFDTAITVQDI